MVCYVWVLKFSGIYCKKYYLNTPGIENYKLWRSHIFLSSCPSTPTTISLGWKHDLLAGHHFGHVQVEEVAVKHGLDDTGHNSDDVIEAFEVVAVDPVEDVERAVGAKSEEVVGGDGLSLSGLGHHEQLGEDRDTLEID